MGVASDPLLHRRLRAADRVRLSLAGAADQRRLRDEHARRAGTATSSSASLQHSHPAGRCRWCWSGSAAGSWACARWSPTSSPRTTSPMPSWRGVSRGRILGSYVMRNALVPQVTGLAMSLGAIFNGAIITEQVFGYPGLGTLLVVGGPCRRLQPGARHHHVSIIAVSVGGAADRPALSAARSAREGRVEHVPRLPRPPPLQPRVRASASCCWRRSSLFAAAVVLLALSAERHLRRAARHAAVLAPLSRHHLARPGRVLAADLRDPQHAAVRLRRRAAQPRHLARGRPGRRATRAAGSTAC